MTGGLAYSFLTFNTKPLSQKAEGAHEVKIHITDSQGKF